MVDIMPFEKFEYLMKQVQAYEEKRNRISDFFEEEICTDSWCFFNVGEDLATSITNMLADEFNCWYKSAYTSVSINKLKEELGVKGEDKEEVEYPKWWDKSVRTWENDIEYWLYEDHKKITVEGQEVPIETLQEFYDYLVKFCVDKKRN